MASSPRIEELRKKFEENPRRYFAPLANEYRKAGDVQQAITICREHLPQQPGHMSGHIVFGQALYEARIFDEARAVFETALSLDPENLIALRHLGDIALITGDNENAKVWYKRVLEADPRNEEIQAQLASVERAAASAPTPAITPAIPDAPPPTPAPVRAPAPSASAPTVVMKAVPMPGRAPAPSVTPTSPTAEIDVGAVAPPPPATEPTVEVPATPVPEPEPPQSTLEGLEGTAAAGAEAPIGSFSLDGLETTSLSADSAGPPAPMPLADLDFGPSGAPPPAPPPAPVPMMDLDIGPAATPDQAPTVELDFGSPPAPAPAAPTVEFDLAPATSAASASEPAPALDFEVPSAASSPSVDLPEIEAPPVAEAPMDLELSIPDAPVTEPPAAPPAAAPMEPATAQVPTPHAAGAPAGPFVTETMAELYVQQGHLEEALRVYRALLVQRPADASLLGRIAALEAPAIAQPMAAEPQGPTMRDLLIAIASRRPGYRPDWPGGNGSAASLPPDVAPHSAVPEAALRQPEPDDRPRDDRLGPGLGFGSPAADAQQAAQVLARAFSSNGDSGGPPLLAGAAARPAGNDLTLNTVFKDAEAAPAPSSFSFDQFFSQRASAEHPVPGSPEGQAAESAEEVAQFTQWLEGLKRR